MKTVFSQSPWCRAALVGAALSLLSPVALAAAAPASVITVAGSEAHVLAPTAVSMVQSAPDTFWLGSPTAPKNITIFLDPNCSICHELYEQLQPLVRSKKVAVRVIPVGVIRASSLGKSAHLEMPLIDRQYPHSAPGLLAQDEKGFQGGLAGGHISPVSDPLAEKAVQEHNEVLDRLTRKYSGFPKGRIETPVVVAKIGGIDRVIFGAPIQGAAAFLRHVDSVTTIHP